MRYTVHTYLLHYDSLMRMRWLSSGFTKVKSELSYFEPKP